MRRRIWRRSRPTTARRLRPGPCCHPARPRPAERRLEPPAIQQAIFPVGGHLLGVKLGDVKRLRGELAEFVGDVSGLRRVGPHVRPGLGRRAQPHCGALGKRANCQVAVSVHAATNCASCPLDWQLHLPREWTDDPARCRRGGAPEGAVHLEKWRPALGLLDNVLDWGLKAPVVVADAGYGADTPFRHGLQERGLSYVLALTGKASRSRAGRRAVPPGLRRTGPPALPRYRTPPRSLDLQCRAGLRRGRTAGTARCACRWCGPRCSDTLGAASSASERRTDRHSYVASSVWTTASPA
ncbi:transposase [Kitasatospora sp. NPDC051914]|uniref:transposase n=1 Tax=Kitasatospora sp. NPDC051914 TaxID=3154945 RepID=UPI003417D72C